MSGANQAEGPRVLVVGDANLDLVLRGDVRPRFGQSEQLLDSADLTLGGSASLVAHGLARLGTRVTLCAAIGDDSFGERTAAILREAGVELALATGKGQNTGLSVILSDGDRAILTHLGAIATLGVDDLPALDGFDHLHVASPYLVGDLLTDLPELLVRARAAGLTTSVDTNDDPTRQWPELHGLLRGADVVLPNDAEAMAWARALDLPHASVAEAAAAVSALGPTVVVKCGAEGGIAYADGAEVAAAPPPPTTPVDTTGAGDSFDAGWLHARVGGASVYDALRAAAHAGALSTRTAGGAPAQATAEELSHSLAR